MAVVSMVEWPNHFCRMLSGTPEVMAATPKP